MKKNPMQVKVDLELILEMIFWARRYCDGRSTYAPSSFNQSYRMLDYQTLNKISENDKKDEALTENGKYWPYAQDGMHDEETGSFDARPRDLILQEFLDLSGQLGI